MLQKLAPYYKAVAAFCALLVPFLTIVATSLEDAVVTGNEWVLIGSAAAALLGGTKAVYQVRNHEDQ